MQVWRMKPDGTEQEQITNEILEIVASRLATD